MWYNLFIIYPMGHTFLFGGGLSVNNLYTVETIPDEVQIDELLQKVKQYK